MKFLNKLKRKGFNVLACDGNHEHYSNVSSGRDVFETQARFREDFSSTGELSDGTPVVLYNGWYRVYSERGWASMMNDSFRCRLDPETVNSVAEQQAYWVKLKLQEWKDLQYKGVVVTHTAPCEESLNPEYEGSITNEWYWSPYMRPLLNEFKDQILVWCHGHTHAAADVTVDGVRVVANPRGYPGENPCWEPLTVEV